MTHRYEGGATKCDHFDRCHDERGEPVFRACPEDAVEEIEGWFFCELHLPPGPKVA